MTTARTLLTVCCLLLLSAGCASTRLTDVWKNPNYKNGGISSVLVIGVSAKQQSRLLFEKNLAAALTGAGVTAVVSSDVLSKMDKLNKEEITQAAVSSRCDSVIITHLVGIENKEVYQPPVYDRSMYSSAYTLGNYYASAYEYVIFPGAVYEQTLVRLETNLYDTASEALLWRASSKTIDPKSVSAAIGDVSTVLVQGLKKSGFIKTK